MYSVYLFPDESTFVLSLVIAQSDSGTFIFQEFRLSESLTLPVDENLTLEQVPLKVLGK